MDNSAGPVYLVSILGPGPPPPPPPRHNVPVLPHVQWRRRCQCCPPGRAVECSHPRCVEVCCPQRHRRPRSRSVRSLGSLGSQRSPGEGSCYPSPLGPGYWESRLAHQGSSWEWHCPDCTEAEWESSWDWGLQVWENTLEHWGSNLLRESRQHWDCSQGSLASTGHQESTGECHQASHCQGCMWACCPE